MLTAISGCASRWGGFGGVGMVAIQPTNTAPSHSQIGCSMRVRGRPSRSTVATEAQTIEWAVLSPDAGPVLDVAELRLAAVIDPVGHRLSRHTVLLVP